MCDMVQKQDEFYTVGNLKRHDYDTYEKPMK